jgi:serine/threonine protein kinase
MLVAGDVTPTNRFGRYQLLERLGEGGMAEVHLARQSGPVGITRYVALKRMRSDVGRDPELAQMFLDEARLAVLLVHPSIVTVLDAGQHGDSYFLAMEYIEGQDLRQTLQRATTNGVRIPAECALYIAAKVARALDFAHTLTDGQGRPLEIVHRDVSPANVLVSYRGEVKLADFGIARAAHRLRQTHTEAGTLKGKIRYMSPEQARGEALDGRSDLFAVGTVLLELLTMRAAFADDSELKSLKRVQSSIPNNWEELKTIVPADALPVITRAMQLEPGNRHPSGAELADELEALLRARDPRFGAANLGAFMSSLFTAEQAMQRTRLAAFDRAPTDSHPDIAFDRTSVGTDPSQPRVPDTQEDGDAATTLGRTPRSIAAKRPRWPMIAAGLVGVGAVGVMVLIGRAPGGLATPAPAPPVARVEAPAPKPIEPPAPAVRKDALVTLSTNAPNARAFLDRSATDRSSEPAAAGGGLLKFAVPPNVEWSLRLEADGYKPQQLPLKLMPGQEVSIPLVMETAAPAPIRAAAPSHGHSQVQQSPRPATTPAPAAPAAPKKPGTDVPNEHIIDPFGS